MSKLILINPPYYRLLKRFSDQQPLGLGYISAVLKKNGYDVKIVNYDYYPKANYKRSEEYRIFKEPYFRDHPIWQQICESLKKYDLDIVGLTSTTAQFNSVLKIAEIIKLMNPESVVIVGGVHATALPEEVLANDCIDVVAIGESEMTMLELVQTINSGSMDFRNVNGIYYKENGQVFATSPRKMIENLDELPLYDREYYDIDGNRLEDKYGSAIIITSRGCPYNCSYCARNIMWGNSLRYRSIENVFSEIEYLIDKYGIKSFNFQDDCFIFNKKRILKLCRLINEKYSDIKWSCQTRGDAFLDEEVLKEMKKSGCSMISFGIESGSGEVLKEMNKNINIEKLIENSRLVKKYGLKLNVYVILGYPNETRESIKQTEDLLVKLDPDKCLLNFFTPFPGSPVYGSFRKNGRIVEDNWWGFCVLNYNLVFNHEHLSKKELIEYCEDFNSRFSK